MLKNYYMDKKIIFNDLVSILKNEIGLSIDIENETALLAGGILDSMDFMNYVTMVEVKYSLKISDDDIGNYKLGIISNMIDYIDSKFS